MARLVVESGPLEGRVFPIDPGVTIGREKHNDIPMPQSRHASREHCKVWREGPHRFAVADFGSTNGTLVNDEKVVRHTLADGDRIGIGDVVFRFELDEEDKPKPKAKPAEARPDLAAVLRGEAAPSRPVAGGGGTGETPAFQVKERILQYQKTSGKGTILSADMDQLGGAWGWVVKLVLLAVVVGVFVLAMNFAVVVRTTGLPGWAVIAIVVGGLLVLFLVSTRGFKVGRSARKKHAGTKGSRAGKKGSASGRKSR